MVLVVPTPAPEIRQNVLKERQLGGLTSIIGSIISGGGSSDTGGSTDTGGGSTSPGSGSGDTTSSTSTTSTSSSTTTSSTSQSTSSTPVTVVTTGVTTTTPVVTSVTSSRDRSSDSTTSTSNVVTSISTRSGGVVVTVTSSASAATGATDHQNDTSSSSKGAVIGGVVGGVVGGLALLTALVLLLIVWRRRKSRTGHGWFLCFGTRPNKGNKDFDVDWPTFDPTVGAAGVGGTLGSRSGRGRNQAVGGTLPELDDADQYNNENDDDMRELASGTHGSYSNYYGAPPSQGGYSSGPHTNPYGPSEEGHFSNQGWGAMAGAGVAGAAVGGAAAGATNTSPSGGDSAPTYDHLDPPEVREARAREQAEAHAQAMTAYGGGGGVGYQPSSPPMSQQQYSPGYYPASSPPTSQRPLSDHRLSTGTTQALANSLYFDGGEPGGAEESGTVQADQQRMLHLHNPDA